MKTRLFRIEDDQGGDFYVNATTAEEAIRDALREGQEYAGPVEVYEQVHRGRFSVASRRISTVRALPASKEEAEP